MEKSPTNADSTHVRVLSLIDSLGPGGAERSLLEMVPGLSAHGIGVDIAILKIAEPNIESLATEVGIEPSLVGGSNRIERIRKVRDMLKVGGYDLLHTTLFESDVVGRVAAWGTGVPVLTSLVNQRYSAARLDDPNVKASRLRMAKTIDKASAKTLTSHFHAISHAVEAAAIADLGLLAEDITVIPRGRDPVRLKAGTDSPRSTIRSELGIAQSDQVLLSLGRQEYQKGQHYAISALPAVLEEHPSTVLLIAGREGWASGELKDLVESLGLADRVQFLGQRSDVGGLFAASDLFVFPSLYEGLGGSVLEAMALGVPIVASRIPAIVEVLDGTGITVAVADSSSLADAINEILANPQDAADRADLAKERFRKHYSLEKVVDDMSALYRAVSSDS